MKSVEELIAFYDKNGMKPAEIVEQLKAIREEFKAAGDPTMTKVSRLAYEHIEQNGGFNVELELEVEEDEEVEPLDIDDQFGYFLQLMKDNQNPVNREEIQAYKKTLWNDLGY